MGYNPFASCGCRIMVITAAFQAADASSILVTRSIENVPKAVIQTAFAFFGDHHGPFEFHRVFPVFCPVRLIE